jgi:hypothetical protein
VISSGKIVADLIGEATDNSRRRAAHVDMAVA